MSGRELFRKNKILINLIVKLISILPRFLRVFLWDSISPYSQMLFTGIRFALLKSLSKACGDNVRVGKNVTIISFENLSLGNNVSIHANCYIDASGIIYIGNDISIAHNSTILSAEHTWGNSQVVIKYNNVALKSVTICDDVWIGCGVRILGGVTISSRVVVAAGAVVNKNCDSSNLYGGVPIRILKKI